MPTTTSPQTSAPASSGGGIDPISAIANAAGKLFDLIGVALAPGIIAAQSVADRLQKSLPKYRNPFESTLDDPRIRQNQIIIGVLAFLVLIIILAILKTKKHA